MHGGGRKEGRMYAECLLPARPGSGPTGQTWRPALMLGWAVFWESLWQTDKFCLRDLTACPRSHRWAFGSQVSDSGLCDLKVHFGGEAHLGQIFPIPIQSSAVWSLYSVAKIMLPANACQLWVWTGFQEWLFSIVIQGLLESLQAPLEALFLCQPLLCHSWTFLWTPYTRPWKDAKRNCSWLEAVICILSAYPTIFLGSPKTEAS